MYPQRPTLSTGGGRVAMCGDRAGDAVSLMKLSKVAFQSQASLPLMPIIFIKVLYSLETLVGNLSGVEQKGNL